MQPFMEPAELAMFHSFLRCAHRYLEFGSGGSTVEAVSTVSGSVTSVESAADWISKVEAACAQRAPEGLKPFILHADIGPVKVFGYPVSDATREQWPVYHTGIWSHPGSADADLCLVDGRFRVACFLQALLRCDPRTILLIHDFGNRPQYHPVKRFAREIARAGTLSAFRRNADFDPAEAVACLDEYRYQPE